MTNTRGGGPQSISVVIPALNAADTIEACLVAITDQNVDCPFDITVAIGPCSDDTEGVVAATSRSDARISSVSNPSGRTATALNLAIEASAGDLVVRVDAQSVIPAGYIQRIVDTATSTGAANVGGIVRPVGTTPVEIGIAAAMSSAFGAGPAQFRGAGGEPGPTDTVYLGAFDRRALLAVGGYDDSLIRNQDYELNWRLREAGHVVWIDPILVVNYRPRGSYRALASQYFQYGAWKRFVLVRNPRSLRARQLAAPGLIVGLVVSALLLSAGLIVGVALPALYLLAVVAASLRLRGTTRTTRVRAALAFVVMHLAWGGGFVVGRRNLRTLTTA